MKWASAVSVELPLATAVSETVQSICTQLGNAHPDLLVAFLSEHHQASYGDLPTLIGEHMTPGLFVGCSAGGVIGGGREVEGQPALSLTAAILPGVDVTPLAMQAEALPAPDAHPSVWEEFVHVKAETHPHFLLLPDPFTFDAEGLLKGLDAAFPNGAKVGGLASGGRQPGMNVLYLGENVHRSGLVGVALSGNIDVGTIVAQGCRPIGDPMFVTRCDRNVIHELDGQRPSDVLLALYEGAEPRDRPLFQHSLFVGIVMQELQTEYRHGDFLIRNILGIDQRSGGLAVGAMMREGMVIQCHLRDAKTSADDLQRMLSSYDVKLQGGSPEGSLLFSCLGRGESLYGEPDHDTAEFRRHLGEIPIGGFFCNGEIGPVHGTAFVHGYTSAFALFRSRR